LPLLAETYLRVSIDLPERYRGELVRYLVPVAEVVAQNIYGAPIPIEVGVLEGSTRIWINAVAASLAGLMVGYGTFRQSIDYLAGDARLFGEAMRDKVISIGLSDDEIAVFQRRLGVVGRIQRALIRIDRLENNHLYKEEVKEERERVKAILFDILYELDAQDRQILLSNIPLTISKGLDEKTPPWAASLPSPMDQQVMVSADSSLWPGIAETKFIASNIGEALNEPTVSFDASTGKIVRPNLLRAPK
jgi:hypothetical protein